MHWKLTTQVLVLIFLIFLNLRGVKESVTFLLPIFLVFVVLHFVLITYGIVSHLHFLPEVLQHATAARRTDPRSRSGSLPMLFILLRAYSLGGGTYTGIEAVSNGVQILREPRVHNAKKTMLYMALSLAFTAGGILLCYLLVHAAPVPGKTLNAVLAEALFGPWRIGRSPSARRSSSSRSSRRARSSSSRRRPASSTGRASSRTWPSTPGCRTASRSSPTGW